MFKKLLLVTLLSLGLVFTWYKQPVDEPDTDTPAVEESETVVVENTSWADSVTDVLKIVPGLKQGVAYSFDDDKFHFLSTMVVAEIKPVILELGYSDENKIVGVASVSLFKLKDYISTPVFRLIECNLGFYAGYGRVAKNNEFDWGISATFLKIKF